MTTLAASEPGRGAKAPDAFRTISEVADDVDVPQHVLRFWETRFPQIKPLKRGGGRRYYRREDVDLVRGIRALLYGQGYTIKGVQRILREGGVRGVQAVGRGEGVALPEPAEPAALPAAPPAALANVPAVAREAVRPIVHDGALPEAEPPGLAAGAREALAAALADLHECRRVLAALKPAAETDDPGA